MNKLRFVGAAYACFLYFVSNPAISATLEMVPFNNMNTIEIDVGGFLGIKLC